MARIIHEVQPRFAFVENSPMLTSRGLGRVLGDLAQMGFDAKWGVLGAGDIGANHKRDRFWLVGKMANTSSRRYGLKESKIFSGRNGFEPSNTNMANSDQERLQGSKWICQDTREIAKWGKGAHGPIAKCCPAEYGESNWWDIEPDVGRVADGVAARVDRLKAIGNGQVPLCAATAWRLLNDQ